MLSMLVSVALHFAVSLVCFGWGQCVSQVTWPAYPTVWRCPLPPPPPAPLPRHSPQLCWTKSEPPESKGAVGWPPIVGLKTKGALFASPPPPHLTPTTPAGNLNPQGRG